MTRASVYTSERPWRVASVSVYTHGGASHDSGLGVRLTRPCFVTCDHVGRMVSKKTQVDCLLVFSVI